MPYYTVEQGDCISSISFQFGFAPATIWNHPQNAALQQQRKDPYTLFPGDMVFIPEKELRVENRPTDARHKFVCKAVPEFLSVRFLDAGEPCAGLPYALTVDGLPQPSGHLDGQGALSVPIPPASKQAVVTVSHSNRSEVYRLLLGHLDPVSESSGVRGRLTNLGYFAGTDQSDPEGTQLAAAVKAFQLDQQMLADCGLDELTRQKLQEAHGS